MRLKKILVIDDSEVVLERVKRALTMAGHEVIATTNIVGNARHLPSCDLVIIDYHMPGLDGPAVLASMRSVAHSMKNTCPFFLYTSYENVARNYVALGFDGVLTHKGDELALVHQVASVFRTMDMREEKRIRAEKRGSS